MSRVYKNSSVPVQKYCKVCHDAGKTEQEYRSHFTRETRDPHSKIVCPTLLSIECRYCFKKGHTVKYCVSLKNKDKKEKIENNAETKPQTQVKKANANMFMVLDSDSEEEKEEKEKEEFPALSTETLHIVIPSNGTLYADALNKPVPKTPTGEPPKSSIQHIPAPWSSGLFTKVPMKSWAAWDSDSDEDC